MSLPQNLGPRDPKPPVEEVSVTEPIVEEDPQVSEVDASEPVETEAPEEEDTSAEDASDAQLRQWAKDNGIDGVPANGKLSATWRDQITSAMASALTDVAIALDPKGGDSVEATSSESSISVKKNPDEEAEEPVDEPDEELVVEEPEPVAPEFETGTYRSVFKAPNTFVTSQAYTA